MFLSHVYEDASPKTLLALNLSHDVVCRIRYAVLFPHFMSAVTSMYNVQRRGWVKRRCPCGFIKLPIYCRCNFLYIGNGDIVPTSCFGRGITVLTCILGAVCTTLG
ncbi:hypothetical protein MAR_017664 [Mya arenaria]|uniref:Potassium channel domain-containing protein n=1 Tax=Mya arenaria TaxID=6604 RepID=A0ABY7EKJ8_MYAAR|nr:hypothetical protein MAR_017664 [Mya arenaria]